MRTFLIYPKMIENKIMINIISCLLISYNDQRRFIREIKSNFESKSQCKMKYMLFSTFNYQ